MWNSLHVKFVCVTLYGHEIFLWFLYSATDFFFFESYWLMDEHGLTLRAILQLTRRSVLARGSGYWNEVFRNIRTFCFIFWDSVQKIADPFVGTWRMNCVRSAEIIWTSEGEIRVLANYQLDALFHVFIYFISLFVSSITVLIIRRSNCINTSSGMISLCKWLLGMPVRKGTSWPA